MQIEQAVSLAHELIRQGCRVSLSLHAELPLNPEEPTEAIPPAKPVATNRTVQWALNRLKAAAGQPNRDLVRKFLFLRNWIGPAEEPDNWKLEHVPTDVGQLNKVISELTQFERDQRQPSGQAPTA